MSTLTDKLLKYSKTIEEKMQERNILQGKLEAKLDELKNAGFDSEDSAKAWLETEKIKLQKLQTELEGDITEFETLNSKYLN